jgi:uncharacterized membrane protein YeaQ/YmgE (transglycosylase-associated protein family)
VGTESLLIFLIIGALAGWLGGIIVKGYGLGLIGDMVVGIIGAFIGGWLLPKLHLFHGVGFVSELISATIGAVILLLLLRVIRRA